ncbi:MAG: beta-lactamase family protein, partial [Sphingomonadales bacterium]|nr:beta-lactamase family protein [Sphingomonadales bacterium]
MHIVLLRALWLAILVAGTLPGAALAAGLDRSFFARVDRGLEGGLEIFNAPGLSVAIVEGDEVVYAKGFGFANKSNGIPADADTLYYIGSTTKALTATLAMILRDQGIVALDAPVQDYLPASTRVPRPTGQSPITLRHLLSHTAGLPKDPPNRKNLKIEGPIDPAVWDVYNIPDLYEALATTELESAVGETWRYSNMGMGLAGHVLERAAGKPYEALLKEHILEPLGMSDTAITLDEGQVRRLAAFYWDAEGNRTEQPRARFGEVAAMGGVTSSVRDMAKFAIL